MLDKEEGRPLVVLEAKHSYGLKFDDSHLQVKMVVQVNLQFPHEERILTAIGTCIGGFLQHDDVEPGVTHIKIIQTINCLGFNDSYYF